MFTEPSTALHFYVRPTVDFLNKFKLMRFATIQIVFYTETRQSFMTVALCTFGFVFFFLSFSYLFLFFSPAQNNHLILYM